jgi:CheY-like chemotaxis protein/two-component sensor histidine kinase
VEVSSLFVNSLTIVREKAATRNIRLALEVEDGLGSMMVDARKVKQIVYNLLSNAVKFTADGGQVTLRAAKVPRARVGRLEERGNRSGRGFMPSENTFAEFLEISVTDTGIGMAAEDLEHLFKPFSQIDSGLARKFEGTGLGLAMVKLLADLHGGSVAVESETDAGSRFTVWLPLRRMEERRAAAAMSAPVVAPRPMRASDARTALVVDDDFTSAGLIRIQLEAEGFTVLHAVSAEEGLRLAAQQPLSLITLDIALPKMDGWDFLTRIKQVPALRHVPVVIISILADFTKGFALGAAAVMQKPVTRKELYDSLAQLGLFVPADGQPLTALVVDDDPKAVELVAVRLAAIGVTVLRAFGGQEAIDLTRAELPGLIVLDLMMPSVNGFDVVEALRERPDTAEIPIIVMTARRITAEDHQRLDGAVTTIMEKAQFDRARFTTEVRRAMSGRQMAP